MKTHGLALVGMVLAAPLLMGVNECGGSIVWAETDSSSYKAGVEGTATLHNDTASVAYLPGCATFNYEKAVSGAWQDQGPDIVCFWEGTVRPLGANELLETAFAAPDAGTWRLRYTIGWGCTEGQPMSRADCTSTEEVYTPEFVVEGSVNRCEDLASVDFGMCEMVLGWGVVNGKCELLSGCGDQGRSLFASELDCVSACDTDCSMWRDLRAAEVDSVSTCTSAKECVDVPGTSCGCTQNLVVNSSADLSEFWKIDDAMQAAGCGTATICSCPAADGFVCEAGHCRWNYL